MDKRGHQMIDRVTIRPARGLLLAGVMLASAGLIPGATADATISGSAHQSRVVARVDVDGDQRPDHVRYFVLSDDLVEITVETADGLTRSRRLNTEWWPRGHWHGAALLDGRPGQELVVGTSMGAHTPLFSVLTWRGDRLVKESAPGRWGLWPVDAYYNGYFGWLRTRSSGHVHMTARSVTRDDGVGHHWSGQAITFTWRAGRWVRSATRPLSIQGDHNASRIGGWRVSGLKRWPW